MAEAHRLLSKAAADIEQSVTGPRFSPAVPASSPEAFGWETRSKFNDYSALERIHAEVYNFASNFWVRQDWNEFFGAKFMEEIRGGGVIQRLVQKQTKPFFKL